MALSPGDKFGPYLLIAPIGKGGMGEVWKARDTRLDRIVAMKFSQEKFSERFEREAKAISSLNHPNVCTLYDVGPNYLVMEYIEGTPLKGPLLVDQALKYSVQICDTLDAAHKKGITHRDLKPANILVTKAGIKLLDFGLAKLATSGIGQAPKPDDATLTMALTGKNEIVGTLFYMSPEQLQSQANGQEIDARSDIFSFGIVLYEMLTGKRAFEGASRASVIAAIMERPAPSIADVAPSALDWVLKRCLEKDPDNRWQTARDLKAELERIASAPESGSAVAAAPAHLHSRFGWMPWAVTGLFFITAAALAFVHFREVPPEQHSVRFQVAPPEKSNIQNFRLSPDGHFLAFIANDRKLWVRPLDSLQANPLPGTEGASDLFWSPDSQFIAFFAQGELKKIAASGGPPQVICDAKEARGGTWSRDGVILFAPTSSSGLFQVPAGGGMPAQVIKPAGNFSHRYPEFLPDGSHFLYTVLGGKTEDAGIYAGSLDGKPSVRLFPDVSNAMYTPAVSSGRSAPGRIGYLLFRRGETLIAQPFDAAQLRLSGDSFPVAERVGESSALSFKGAFSLSENGTLAYGAGATAVFQLVWTDRTGKLIGSFGPPGAYTRFRLAPDEKRILFDITNRDVWVLDAVRGVTARLTSNPALDNVPVWSPDGLRILFSSNRSGGYDVYTKSASGTGQEELLIKMGTGTGAAVDWSRDGRWILYQMPGPKTGQDLWVFPQFPEGAGGDRKPFPYLQSQFDEQDGWFSPDGKSVAYVSNESGRDEIYVQSFPVSGAKFQISSGGGSEPQWRNDGTELFYLAADGNLMAVPTKLGRSGSESFQSGLPRPLMPVFVAGATTFQRSYAVSNDGQRFLIHGAAATGNAPSLTIVLNWQAGLKK